MYGSKIIETTSMVATGQEIVREKKNSSRSVISNKVFSEHRKVKSELGLGF